MTRFIAKDTGAGLVENGIPSAIAVGQGGSGGLCVLVAGQIDPIRSFAVSAGINGRWIGVKVTIANPWTNQSGHPCRRSIGKHRGIESKRVGFSLSDDVRGHLPDFRAIFKGQSPLPVSVIGAIPNHLPEIRFPTGDRRIGNQCPINSVVNLARRIHHRDVGGAGSLCKENRKEYEVAHI